MQLDTVFITHTETYRKPQAMALPGFMKNLVLKHIGIDIMHGL